MKWILSAVVALTLTPPAAASSFTSSGRGTTTADFLTLGVGARATAMGEAYSAVVDEAGAVYWNPAALTRIPNASATFMHAAYIGSSYFDYGAFAKNLGKLGSIGAGVQYFSAGSIAATDATGSDAGTLTPYDLALSLAYAHKLDGLGPLDGFSVGVTGKFVESKIVTSARTFAADAGILSPPFFNERLRLALTAVNLGGTMKFDQATEQLPVIVRFGSSFKITPAWLASVDASAPRNDHPYVGLGTEYWLVNGKDWGFSGRAGFNSETIGSIDGFSGIAVGFGLRLRGLAMDYGFVPYGGIGQAHRISITYNF